jgi:hypothetical protein
VIKYTAEFYQGRKIGKGGGFLSRVGYQVVATDPETGKRRYVFHTKDFQGGKTPCLKSSWIASHYKTGPNKADQETLNDFAIWAENTAKELNETQPY